MTGLGPGIRHDFSGAASDLIPVGLAPGLKMKAEGSQAAEKPFQPTCKRPPSGGHVIEFKMPG